MKTKRYPRCTRWCGVRVRLFLPLILLLFLSGCQESRTTGSDPVGPDPRGTLLGYGDCKLFDKEAADIQAPGSDQDCIEYDYDGGSVLSLKHINAGFNCCPVKIMADIDIENHLIIIKESEAEAGCHCLCLFDVDYEITDLEPGEYTVRVIEPYVHEGDEKLEFTVDLSNPTSGRHCVHRRYYPWNTNSGGTEPTGNLIDRSECKGYAINGEGTIIPNTKDCIAYAYYEGNILLLKHINAGFNCCPDIDVDIVIENSTIIINEVEIEGLCDCLCLFDLDYEIKNLEPGTYTIKVIEPYLQEGDAPLEFTVDLALPAPGIGENTKRKYFKHGTSPANLFCVNRYHYPWGH